MVKVDLVDLAELVGCGEDVGEAVEDHVDRLVVLGGQEVAERLEDALAAQVHNLLNTST